MSKLFDFGGVNLDAGGDDSNARPLDRTPFCIAILGDFSGRANRGVSEPGNIATRRVTAVDRDNFEEVLARHKPELRLKLGEGGSLLLSFSELDDFHPDRIFERLEAFATLRGLRTRLENPSSFGETADELGLRRNETAKSPPSKTDSSPVMAPSAARLASGSLLDEMIEQTESRISQESGSRAPDPIRDFAKRVAEQNLESSPDPRQPEILGVMDRAISALMRAILHNPDFQALEAIWRATFLLVRQLETGSQLKLYLIDVSKEEIAADLNSKGDLREAGLYRLLVEKSIETPGAELWSVLVGNFTFDSGKDAAALLSLIGRLARRSGAPFLAQASPEILGCPSLTSTPDPREWNSSGDLSWSELRNRPEADSIGLALPRFLLRLPYGKETSPLESFDFEEMNDQAEHDDYLWGNPAFVLALLLGQSFAHSSWEMRPGGVPELAGLPLHVYGKDGGSETKP